MNKETSIFSVLLVTAALLASLSVAVILFRKFQHKLEPVHVFVLNYLGTASSILIAWFVITILKYTGLSKTICYEYLLLMSSSLCCSMGILCMQVDRIIALCLPLRYNSIISTKSAINACSCNVVVAIFVTFCVHFVDKDYVKCADPPLLIFTRSTNILFDGLSSILAVSATIILTISAWEVHRKLEKNAVHPFQTSRHGRTEQEPEVAPDRERRKIRRMNKDPNMFFRGDLENAIFPPKSEKKERHFGSPKLQETLNEESLKLHNFPEIALSQRVPVNKDLQLSSSSKLKEPTICLRNSNLTNSDKIQSNDSHEEFENSVKTVNCIDPAGSVENSAQGWDCDNFIAIINSEECSQVFDCEGFPETLLLP